MVESGPAKIIPQGRVSSGIQKLFRKIGLACDTGHHQRSAIESVPEITTVTLQISVQLFSVRPVVRHIIGTSILFLRVLLPGGKTVTAIDQAPFEKSETIEVISKVFNFWG